MLPMPQEVRHEIHKVEKFLKSKRKIISPLKKLKDMRWKMSLDMANRHVKGIHRMTEFWAMTQVCIEKIEEHNNAN